MANDMPSLKAFFSTPEKPVTNKEMLDFWKSLEDDEKEYYKTADIS